MSKRGLFLTGFTIIELLIALSIFAVIAVTLSSAFFAGLSVWKRSSGAKSDVYQDIGIVFDEMASELRNMVYFTKDEESLYAFSGTPDSITFMTLEEYSSEKMEPGREIVKVQYSFDDTKGGIIRRSAGFLTGFNIDSSEKEVLLKDVDDFKVEYCYDSGDEDEPYLWKGEWRDSDLRTPRGIRMTAFIKGRSSAGKISGITRIVFISTGILGKKEI